MTTIACNSTTMSADTQFTAGNISYGGHKIFKGKGYIVAFSGEQQVGIEFVAWLAGGDKPERASEEFEALLLNSEGQIYYYESRYIPILIEEAYMAIGSGSQIALGALLCGRNPKQAVQLACIRDVFSSGPVETYANI